VHRLQFVSENCIPCKDYLAFSVYHIQLNWRGGGACGHSLFQCIIWAHGLWSQPTSVYYLSICLVVTAYFTVLSKHLPRGHSLFLCIIWASALMYWENTSNAAYSLQKTNVDQLFGSSRTLWSPLQSSQILAPTKGKGIMTQLPNCWDNWHEVTLYDCSFT
jgi:hypothetical protein